MGIFRNFDFHRRINLDFRHEKEKKGRQIMQNSTGAEEVSVVNVVCQQHLKMLLFLVLRALMRRKTRILCTTLFDFLRSLWKILPLASARSSKIRKSLLGGTSPVAKTTTSVFRKDQLLARKTELFEKHNVEVKDMEEDVYVSPKKIMTKIRMSSSTRSPKCCWAKLRRRIAS